MRVVAYTRESADPSEGRTGFAQQEQVRRYASEHGLALVAVCQDSRRAGAATGRDGYLSLLGVVAAGGVDGVLLPGLDALSTDEIVQEIMLWDLRSRGVQVISANGSDRGLLEAEPPGPSRMLIRDVLTRVAEHASGLGAHRLDPPSILPQGDVMIHILRADEAEAPD